MSVSGLGEGDWEFWALKLVLDLGVLQSREKVWGLPSVVDLDIVMEV